VRETACARLIKHISHLNQPQPGKPDVLNLILKWRRLPQSLSKADAINEPAHFKLSRQLERELRQRLKPSYDFVFAHDHLRCDDCNLATRNAFA
jgi:hypothetical protein